MPTFDDRAPIYVQIADDLRRAVLAGVAGNVLEWYDFAVYGFFAAAIGARFFPASDPTASLIAASMLSMSRWDGRWARALRSTGESSGESHVSI